MIDHPAPAGGGTTVYGHMWDAFATGLKPSSSVAAGQHIAYVGSNGQSSGPFTNDDRVMLAAVYKLLPGWERYSATRSISDRNCAMLLSCLPR